MYVPSRLRHSWSSLLLPLVLAPSLASAQPFHVAPVYEAGTVRNELVSADLNGDGRADLVGADWESRVVVLLADGAGGFAPPSYPPIDAVYPLYVAIADFNSDSIPDLAVADNGVPFPFSGILPGVDGKLVLLLGDGKGGFGSQTTVSAGPNYAWVVSADFNGDGHADLMTESAVWLGDGRAGFAPPIYFSQPLQTAAPSLVDFNGDGHLDLAVPGDLVQVRLGDGAGGFGPSRFFQTGGHASFSLAVGDFNGDQKPDFTVRSQNGTYFFPGDGTGDFGQPVVSPGVQTLGSIAVDFNGDGRLDLVDQVSTGLGAALGDGAGHFAPGAGYVAGVGGPFGPVLAMDVDGDSHLDLVTAGLGVGVLIGDGTGRFDALQSVPIPVGFLPRVAAADFNEDGKLDVVVTGYSDAGVMLLGDGQGGFSSAGSVNGWCSGAEGLVAADLNGDFHADLLWVAQEGLCVSLGDGHGTLAPPVLTTLTSTASFALADFNEDGRPDVVVSRDWDDLLLVLLSDGLGGFGAPLEYYMPTGPVGVAAGDWDGDGHVDLVSSGNLSHDLSVRFGDGTGNFGPRTVIPAVPLARRIITGDWNGDGRLDLAMDSGQMLLGDGAGSFALAGTFPADASEGVGPVAGDFDVDGRQDIASLAGTQDPTDRLLLSPGDGAGGFGNPWAYYAPTWDAGIAVGDFNGDGRPDLMLGVENALWPFLSISQDTDIAVSASDGSDTAVPGTAASYSVTLTNLGPHSLPGASLTLSLPPALLSPTYVPSAGSYDPATGAWTGLAVPAGGSVTLAINATIDPSATGRLTVAVAAAPAPGHGDPNPGNNAAADVDALTPLADLGVQIADALDPVPAGSAASFEASAANGGPSLSPGGTLTVVLPAGAAFLSADPGCAAAGSVVTCPLPSLVPGQSSTATVSARLDLVGLATTSAAVAGSVPDPQTSNDAAIEMTSVLAAPLRELVPGSTLIAGFSGGLGSPVDAFRVQPAPRTSWEVVVDGVTGDISTGSGPVLEFVDDEAVAHESVPAGAGSSRSLRLENASPSPGEGYVRVKSAGCSFNCGPEDVYRIRALATTLFGARFNNSASQVTVVIVQNSSPEPVSGHVDFWDESGAWLHDEPFNLSARQTLLLGPSDVPAIQGKSGSLTVSHDGHQGALAGKAVAVEPATGFTFDTALVTVSR